MIKFIVPAIAIILIVLFWEKINEFIFDKFNIKLNYLLIGTILLVITVTLLLLNN